MTEIDNSQGNTLCKSCGLCCTGHLFVWAKLRPSELDPAEALGLHVFRDDPTQRGFSQPCPLWRGQCTIYTSSHYPHVCRAYQCKLLKDVLAKKTSLSRAFIAVEQAKTMIGELELLLPASASHNFRERLVARLEERDESAFRDDTDLEFKLKATVLLDFYEKVFGVDDLIEKSDEL